MGTCRPNILLSTAIIIEPFISRYISTVHFAMGVVEKVRVHPYVSENKNTYQSSRSKKLKVREHVKR